MDRRKGTGMVVATLLALLALPAAAHSATFTGGTSQGKPHRVEVVTEPYEPVRRASITWVAKCGGDAPSARAQTIATDFSRASETSFAERFRGRVKAGNRKLKVRYLFAGKRRSQRAFRGTFRLSLRYRPRHGSKRVTCRTGLIHWTAHRPRG